MHHNSFGLYTAKLEKTTFNEGNTKAHKFLIELLCCPIRYAYIEELDRKKLDADLLKDFVGGVSMTVEVMYSTKTTGRIQAKLATNSNKDMNVDVDKGVLRRGLLQYYTSKFVDKPDASASPPQFQKVKGLGTLFLQTRYRRAYLELLLPHVVSYYSNGLYVPRFASQQFESVAEEYDTFKSALLDVCDVGGANDRVWKDDLLEALRGKLGRQLTWVTVLQEIKRLGHTYSRQERPAPKAGGPSCQGVVIGIKWKPTVAGVVGVAL